MHKYFFNHFPIVDHLVHFFFLFFFFEQPKLNACYQGFPSGSDSKESACNAGDLGSIPRLGRPPGGGHGNPLQYSCPWTEEPVGLKTMGSQRVRHITKHTAPVTEAHKNVWEDFIVFQGHAWCDRTQNASCRK